MRYPTIGVIGSWRVEILSPVDEEHKVLELDLQDEALGEPGIPSFAWRLHRQLSPAIGDWAHRVASRQSPVDCHLSLVACCLLPFACRLSRVACCPSPVD